MSAEGSLQYRQGNLLYCTTANVQSKLIYDALTLIHAEYLIILPRVLGLCMFIAAYMGHVPDSNNK